MGVYGMYIIEIPYLLTIMYSIPFNKLLCFPPSFFRSEWPGQASEQQPVKQRKHRIIDPYKLYGPHGYRWFNLRKFFTNVQISQKMCQITILSIIPSGGSGNQGIEITIFYKDCLVMKKLAIGRLPKQIPIFLRCLLKIRFLRGFKRFCGKQNWHSGIDRTLRYSAKVFT